MKIRSIEIVRLRDIPMPHPLQLAWSPGTMKRQASVTVVRVLSDDGLEGIGTGGSPKALREVADRLVGQDPFDTERHARTLRHSGVAWGLEIALWDLIGKACDHPLYKIWGGFTSRVRGYASLVEATSPQDTAQRSLGLIEEGFTGVKIRLHGDRLQDDLAVAQTVRDAVGDSIALMAGANQARVPFSPVDEAGPTWDLRRARKTADALDEMGFLWLEEPLGRYNFDGLGELNRSVSIAIAGGEKNRYLHEFASMLDRGCYDIVQPDALVSEGIGQLRKIAALAEVRNKLCIPHHGGGGIGAFAHLQLAAAVPNAPWVEILRDRAGGASWPAQLVVTQPIMVDAGGWVRLPEAPGLGLELDEGFIQKYAN
jgi:D-galactarolactone cycloisomerase